MSRFVGKLNSVVVAGICICLITSVLLTVGIARQSQSESKLVDTILASLENPKGLCVHLGVKDGQLETALGRGGKFLVHGIGDDQKAIDRARAHIEQQKLTGAVTVELGSYAELPYSDNIANLVVVDDLHGLSQRGLSFKEVMRVVQPGGVFWVALGSNSDSNHEQLKKLAGDAIDGATFTNKNGNWAIFHKQRSEKLDEWTHKRHDASGNPVSTDKQVGVPTTVRWIAGPKWPTGYRKSAVPSVVASEKRLIYVFEDEVETKDGSQLQNSLIARDAFNGLLLWKLKTSKGKPPLISTGNRIYTVLKDKGPLVSLDARSGKIVHTFADVKSPAKLLYASGNLVVSLADGFGCLNPETGKTLWKKPIKPRDYLAGDGRVFVHTDDSRRGGKSTFICFELATGKELWSIPTSEWAKSSPKLVFYQAGILLSASRDGNHVVSAKDGKHLWDYKYALIGHGGSFQKTLYSNGLVWVHVASFEGKKQYAWEGLEPLTGKVVKRVIQPKKFAMKHRCNYDVATENLFMCGSMDFADISTGKYHHFSAARNSCATAGVIPANGLLYTFPHACGCYSMIRGFLGLSTGETPTAATSTKDGLELGPAFGKIPSTATSTGDWPTYRHDVARSASTLVAGPAVLERLWSVQLTSPGPMAIASEWDQKDGGVLSSPVVAGDTVFVAASDHHRLDALDVKTGDRRWSYSAGGRIDCPPTIHNGMCLFGSRDGWVYCLRATDGVLAWRFRAAPQERRIIAYGQLESPWPIVGGVLVHEETAYFVSGRHEGSAGGIFVYAVDLQSGRRIWGRRAETHRGVADVLTMNNNVLQMASSKFDPKTGKSVKSSTNGIQGGRLGLLSDGWYRRPIAMRKNLQLWHAGSRPKAQLLAFNDSATCGFRACESVNGGTGKMSGKALLFTKTKKKSDDWEVKLPLGVQMRGMALSPDRLYVAGQMLESEKSDPRQVVGIYSVGTGKRTAHFDLGAQPIHDGLVVTKRRVFVSTQDGRLFCLGEP